MSTEREEKLNKLLYATDLKEETYMEATIQDSIILHAAAAGAKNRSEDQEHSKFFAFKEDFFFKLTLTKLRNLPELWCLYTKGTSLPYVNCDDDTMNDQALIYTDARFAQKAFTVMTEKQIPVMVVKVPADRYATFFGSFFEMGINEIVVDKEVIPKPFSFELNKFIKTPDFSQLPEQNRPILNPELFLTGIYFMQEAARPEDKRDKEKLRDLEEEILVNIERKHLILPVLLPEGDEKPLKDGMKVPFVKMPNGDMLQPVFTDLRQFSAYNKEKKLRALPVRGNTIGKALIGEIKGIMLNPTSLRIQIPKQKLVQEES